MQEKTLADIIKKARFKKGFSYENLEEKSMIRMFSRGTRFEFRRIAKILWKLRH